MIIVTREVYDIEKGSVVDGEPLGSWDKFDDAKAYVQTRERKALEQRQMVVRVQFGGTIETWITPGVNPDFMIRYRFYDKPHNRPPLPAMRVVG